MRSSINYSATKNRRDGMPELPQMGQRDVATGETQCNPWTSLRMESARADQLEKEIAELRAQIANLKLKNNGHN